nr:WYL domain-containing protein [Phytoactinopolyspora alkaliphila]
MTILFTLQRQRGMTASELADQLEVSVRTVYRDVAALQEAGVPLWTEPGPGGGIRLVDGWRTRLDGLTGDEAAALFLAGAPAAVSDLGLGAVLTAAESKVIATLPPELRGRARRLRERFHLDAPGWFGREDAPVHLGVVADAVWSGKRLDLMYRRADRRVQRRLDPLGLVLKAGVWYVVAAHEGQVRTYRVARIDDAALADEPVVRPEGFELARWWAESAAAFDRSLLRFSCRVKLSPHAMRKLKHVMGPVSADAALGSAEPPDDDGWRIVTLPAEGEDVVATQLVALAPGVEVLEPVTLREVLREAGARLAEHNAPHVRPEGW